MNDENLTLAHIGGLVAVIVMVIIEIMFLGLVLSILWNWFMVSIFGLRVLTSLQAYSLVLVAQAIRGSSSTTQATDDEEKISTRFFKAFSKNIIRSAVLLTVGWIVHLLL